MISLNHEELAIVKNILAKHVPQVAVRVFGSRVGKDHKKYSDLDLLLMSNEKIPREVLFAIQDDFEESDLPFRVDLVDAHRISPEFLKVIEKKSEQLN